MKAAVYTEYGSPDVLQLQEVSKPVPKANELLVSVFATPVKYGDLIARNFGNVSPRQFNMPTLFWLAARLEFGVSKPKKRILGSDFAGRIEAVGDAVTRFKVGDDVFGTRGQSFGATAEYLCIPEDGRVALKPANMSHEEAATVPYGAMTALNLLRSVGLQSGQKVLIIGASGGIGSAAVQLSKRYFGADVVGVCSGPRVELVKTLGADDVIDYTKEDFTERGAMYDVIFDVLGKSSFSRCRGSLKDDGKYLLASFKARQLGQMMWTKMVGKKRVICALSLDKTEDLELVRELVEAGKFRAVIDRRYPLAQAAEAHRFMEGGDRRGDVVITTRHPSA